MQKLPHVHLLSSYPYPVLASLSVEHALDYLLQAPRVVRDLAPVSWTYLHPPGDGTILLAWQPPTHQSRFSSDGYVWLDPESTFTHDVRGYVSRIINRLELMNATPSCADRK